MIDWLTICIQLPHKHITGGYVESVSADGEPEWRVEKKLPCEGSYSDKMAFKSDFRQVVNGKGELEPWVYFSGNPSKWIQGHNVFGIDCIFSLVMQVGMYLHGHGFLNEFEADEWREKTLAGDFEIKRIDINYSFQLANQSEVEHWLRACEKTATMQHRGRGISKGGTVYFGKGSKRWLVRMYSKFIELKAHPAKCPEGGKLLECASKLLRVEVQLNALELERLELSQGHKWSDIRTVKRVWNDKMAGLSMVTAVTDDTLKQMKSATARVYLMWKSGEDLAKQLKDDKCVVSASTFKRHRKILQEFGIDIGAPPPDMTHNVIPMLRVLEATPAECPWWVPLASQMAQPKLHSVG